MCRIFCCRVVFTVPNVNPLHLFDITTLDFCITLGLRVIKKKKIPPTLILRISPQICIKNDQRVNSLKPQILTPEPLRLNPQPLTPNPNVEIRKPGPQTLLAKP